ncbi:putative plastidic glucose transporter 4 protein [Neofusicoccum parvum UCRNP2]|uniref:Putative plastidic glucose transporter 4 protein n=1 Tax=Botryosphaeria parva (strain UCR-NP2) TaxID=1287680 RepID=R1H173_BOTPV|nr:putative plastidic glucose transporter 4 protein [Neofusicoccum parvum UCRNP2]
MWQMWTAFGIMIGFVVSVAFENVDFLGEYSQWRWMLASTSIPPFLVMIQVYLCPESPRWYMEKGKYDKAFNALKRLRKHEIQAARDMYYAYKLLEIEASQREGKNLFKEFFTVKRNRRAAQSSFFVMFMQQFCGVNVIAYYSTEIFLQAGFSRSNALLVSFGTGVTNWVMALPAVYTIDTFGRRNLLLNLTLEELDTVFSVGNREHAQYYTKKLPWYMKKYILRRDVPPFPPLYQFHEDKVHETEQKPNNEKATN